MGFVLLSWFGDILVTVMMGVSCSFVLEVFLVIVYQVILVRSWF